MKPKDRREGSLRQLVHELRRDYERHAASGSERAMLALANYRFGRWVAKQPRPVRFVGGKVYGLGLVASESLAGIFLDRDTDLGEDIHFVHSGNIHINPDTRIGDRVGIMQGVTLGTVPNKEGSPVIEDDVFIGANASVLGSVTIGRGARVSANSLVLNDVPPGALAVGVPAKIIRVPEIRVVSK